jgi:hypothetical protein
MRVKGLRGGPGRRRAFAVLLLALLLTLVGSGCGGDGNTASSSSSSGQETSSEESSGEDSTSTSQESEESVGGEKSIEEYGAEAGGGERGAILSSFHNYLQAIAAGDNSTACSYLSVRVQQGLRQLVKQRASCEQILPKLLAPTAAAISRQQDNGKITKVRVKGDQAFVVFHAPGAKLYMLGLVREGGEWKATTVAASVLVPDL